MSHMHFNKRLLLALAGSCTPVLWNSVFCIEERSGKCSSRQHAHIEGSWMLAFHAPDHILLSLSSLDKNTATSPPMLLLSICTSFERVLTLQRPVDFCGQAVGGYQNKVCSNLMLFCHIPLSLHVFPSLFMTWTVTIFTVALLHLTESCMHSKGTLAICCSMPLTVCLVWRELFDWKVPPPSLKALSFVHGCPWSLIEN